MQSVVFCIDATPRTIAEIRRTSTASPIGAVLACCAGFSAATAMRVACLWIDAGSIAEHSRCGAGICDTFSLLAALALGA